MTTRVPRMTAGATAAPPLRSPFRTADRFGPREAQAIRALRACIQRELPLADAPPAVRAAGERLIARIGAPDFYDVLATLDPPFADDWRDMGIVQRRFASAEAGFDARTRRYSESMRLTLHAAVIQLLLEPARHPRKSLFESFIELHVTAFRENGGWFGNLAIGVKGALDVVRVAPVEAVENPIDLIEGIFIRDPVAIRAARWVNAAFA